MTEPQVSPDNGFRDGPRPGPYRTRPFEQVLHELAQRTGHPILRVRPVTATANGKKGGPVGAARRQERKEAGLAPARPRPARCSTCDGWPARTDSGLCERHHALAIHRGVA